MSDILIELLALVLSLAGAIFFFCSGQAILSGMMIAVFLMCCGMAAMLKPTQKRGGVPR